MVAKEQARNVDPGMGPRKRGTVAGERKAVTSDRPRSKEGCGAQEGIDPEAGKTALGELTGEAPGTFDCSAQYRACRW